MASSLARKVGRDGFKELDPVVTKLLGEDLSEWETDFVNDLADRLEKYGADTFLTARQWEQIERMRDKFDV